MGIQPTKAGYEAYTVALTNLLDSFTCTENTVKGDIVVSLEKQDGTYQITVQAIEAEGTIVIPECFGTDITVSGGDCQVDGNKVVMTHAGQYTITVG